MYQVRLSAPVCIAAGCQDILRIFSLKLGEKKDPSLSVCSFCEDKRLYRGEKILSLFQDIQIHSLPTIRYHFLKPQIIISLVLLACLSVIEKKRKPRKDMKKGVKKCLKMPKGTTKKQSTS